VKPRTGATCPRLTWREIALRAGVRTIILSLLAFVLMTGSAWAAGDPTGAETGTIADVTAAVAGSPTLEEIAGDVGHLEIS